VLAQYQFRKIFIPPGTFPHLIALPVVKGLDDTMQEASHAFVLHSEAAKPLIMLDAPENPDAYDSATPLTDEQLMVAFARGSADAFTSLFQRYKQPLFGFFRRRVTDPAQAEELAQETFLVILRAASHYQASALFRTYLYAIAFKILNAHRRKSAFRATFWGSQSEHSEPSIESTVATEMLLRQAVGKLDSIDREILMLREFEQLSYAEIAELCRIPLNTVRSRLFRARTALHDLLVAPARNSHAKQLAEFEERI
jgi:RNA polymerase sigma-70 factor (ECF subfamily)